MKIWTSPVSEQRPRYDLIVFDFDGTLADTAGWFRTQVNAVADRFGFRQISEEEYEKLRGKSSRDIMKYVGLRRWKIPRIARHLHRRLAEDAESIPLFEGAEETLRALSKAGVTLVLVTSNSEANVRKILGDTLADLFDCLSCGASLFGKARHFKKIVRQFSVPRDRILAIGDEIRDKEAAQKVGFASGLVGWGYAAPGFLKGLHPDHFFEEMDDIVEAVLSDEAMGSAA